jgi:hypothetical protein
VQIMTLTLETLCLNFTLDIHRARVVLPTNLHLFLIGGPEWQNAVLRRLRQW